MANFGRLSAITLLLGVLCLEWVSAEEPQLEKKWTFKGNSGAIDIVVTQFLHNGVKTASLVVYSPDQGPRSISEEARFLSLVLDELPQDGVDLNALGWLSTRLDETDAPLRLAERAAQSSQWRSVTRSGNVPVLYSAVTTMLNDSYVFAEWDAVFRRHGLRLKVAGVEKVGVEPFSKTGAPCPRKVSCDHLRVPSMAEIQINISPMSQ